MLSGRFYQAGGYLNIDRSSRTSEPRETHHFGSFSSTPLDSVRPGGIITLQFSTSAHTENALAIGPKVPFTTASACCNRQIAPSLGQASPPATGTRLTRATTDWMNPSNQWNFFLMDEPHRDGVLPRIEKRLLILVSQLFLMLAVSLYPFGSLSDGIVEPRVVH